MQYQMHHLQGIHAKPVGARGAHLLSSLRTQGALVAALFMVLHQSVEHDSPVLTVVLVHTCLRCCPAQGQELLAYEPEAFVKLLRRLDPRKC